MKLTVKLAPGSIRKEGLAYYLLIAVGILIATRQVHPEAVDGALAVGEKNGISSPNSGYCIRISRVT